MRDQRWCATIETYVPGGGSQQKFGQVCAAQVFKLRVSGTDFGLKTGVSGTKVCYIKMCVSGAENLVKIGKKMVLKC